MTKHTNGVSHTRPVGSRSHTRQKRVKFDSLPESDIQLWIDRAQGHVGRQGWTYDEFDYAELVYCTALYLWQVDKLIHKPRQFPCYVVHSVKDDSRFESPSYSIAFKHFKRLDKDGRAALFHWPNKDQHERLYHSEGYPFERDYGPKGE